MQRNGPLNISIFALALTGTVFSAGCAQDEVRETPAAAQGPAAAIARLSPASGSGVTGTVRFVREQNGIRVTVEITGLTPGEHGFHIHEKGDCSAPDATTAGGHFNPTGEPHASRDAGHRHLGDLGNLAAGPDGRARVEFVDTHLRLTGPNSIVGRSVIVHADRDDLETQPSGNAGARVACGVILAEP